MNKNSKRAVKPGELWRMAVFPLEWLHVYMGVPPVLIHGESLMSCPGTPTPGWPLALSMALIVGALGTGQGPANSGAVFIILSPGNGRPNFFLAQEFWLMNWQFWLLVIEMVIEMVIAMAKNNGEQLVYNYSNTR